MQELKVIKLGVVIYSQDLNSQEIFSSEGEEFLNYKEYFQELLGTIVKYESNFKLTLETTARATLLKLHLNNATNCEIIKNELLENFQDYIEQVGIVEKSETNIEVNIVDFFYQFYE